ncbi:MAG: arginine--tRNA ligase [Candidatus Onthovivens sp.]|nr:arginine--tRNA ligase [Candidatus Onthovivens sp.]
MVDLKQNLMNVIKQALNETFGLIVADEMIAIETPKDKEHGDYASTIALRLSKQLKSNPRDIAIKLKEKLEKEECIEKVEIAGPGFINFFMKKDSLTKIIKTIIELGDDYGRNLSGNHEKVMVEYVSANPTGDLHLGHARGAAYGDSLTRVLSFCGYDVLREYYVNDAGHQIDVLAKSLFLRYKQAFNLEVNLDEIGYQGKDVIKLANDIAANEGDKYLKVSEIEAIEYFKNIGIDLELDKIKRDLDLFRVHFDNYTSERSLYKSNKVKSTLEKLENSGYTFKNENALWLKTTDFNDDKDRVLVKSDGSYTYLLPDIAYHADKFDRGYNKLINLFGADHHGYIARLKGGLKILGYNPDNLEILIIQMVRLMENGQELKMSKRTGNAITIRELCEDVGVDVARFFFLSKTLDSHFDFDLDVARKSSSENPVYYIQYAYARMCSVLKKNSSFALKDVYKLLIEEKEISLIKSLSEFKDLVIDIARTKEIHRLTSYAYKVSNLFHSLYNEIKFIDEDNQEVTAERLALVKATSIVLKNCLNLLGVEVKESM